MIPQQRVEIIKEGKDQEVDFSIWKIALIFFFVALGSFGMVYFFNFYLLFLESKYLVAFLMLLVVYVVFLLLQAMLVKKKVLLAILVLVGSALPFLMFFNAMAGEGFSLILSLGFFFFVVLSILGAIGINSYLENSLKVNFFKVVSTNTPKIITGVFIMVATLAYFNYVDRDLLLEDLERKAVLGMANIGEPIIKIWFPRVSFDITTREFFEGVVYSQLMKDAPAEFRDLPDEIKAEVIRSAASGVRNDIEERFGFLLPEDLEVRENLWNVARENIRSLSPTARLASLSLLIFSILLILRSVAFVFYKPIEIFAFLIFKFLLVAGFIKISAETTQRKFLIMPND